MLIALVISKHWRKYYASSPYNNLLDANYPGFKLFATDGAEISASHTFQDEINECDAVVVDDVLSPFMGFYSNGPKFMVGGDPHAHRREDLVKREQQFMENDFILTGSPFSPRLPQYHYVDSKYNDQLIYLPNSLPPTLSAEFGPWSAKSDKAILTGSRDGSVYPFRHKCATSLRHECVDVMDRSDTVVGEDYYFEISKYKAAITCDSVLKYVVAKYFEIPYCNTLLIAPKPLDVEVELLGFKDRENVFFVKDTNDVRDCVNTIATTSFCEVMSRIAQQWVFDCHNVHSRLEYIKRVIHKVRNDINFKPEDALQIFKQLRLEQENDNNSSNSGR